MTYVSNMSYAKLYELRHELLLKIFLTYLYNDGSFETIKI